MKKLSYLLTIICLSIYPQAAQAAQANGRGISFSRLYDYCPTISSNLPEYISLSKDWYLVKGLASFQEHNWRIYELYPSSKIPYIKEKLREYSKFEVKHKQKLKLCDTIFYRQIDDFTIIKGSNAVSELSEMLERPIKPSPTITTSSKKLVQIKNGFSIELSEAQYIYGISNNSGITVLGMLSQNPFDGSLTKAFIKLNREKGLVLVDWKNKKIHLNVNDQGIPETWSPRQNP